MSLLLSKWGSLAHVASGGQSLTILSLTPCPKGVKLTRDKTESKSKEELGIREAQGPVLMDNDAILIHE